LERSAPWSAATSPSADIGQAAGWSHTCGTRSTTSARERVTIHTLCTRISERKDVNTSLTAAIRVFALAYFRAAATEEGHMRASHGQGNPFAQTPFGNEEQSAEPVVNLRRSVG
jgi:predicted DNA-binding ribbon-helix-helix protein